jgi:hypothetical protein
MIKATAQAYAIILVSLVVMLLPAASAHHGECVTPGVEERRFSAAYNLPKSLRALAPVAGLVIPPCDRPA